MAETSLTKMLIGALLIGAFLCTGMPGIFLLILVILFSAIL